MKKIISKILIIFIIVVMMFEFIVSSNICNASIDVEKVVNGATNLAGGIVSIVYWPKRLTAVSLAFIMDLLTANIARDSGINDSNGLEDLLITPFNVFFNKYKLLDINFFDIDGVDSDTIAYTFRTTVAQWYYVMRLIAITILMVVLIYVGIRMALSTIAEDKAKYKKMLIDWCCSLALVFILHYIAIFIIYCNDAIVSALKDSITDLNAETQLSGILVDIGLRGVLGIGITSIAAVLVFVFIVFQTIAFLLAYINRVLKVGFLLIISPLISITYSIDKMGDGKAQALGAWLKEFIYTILIQPFHCIMYMAFVRPAITLLIGNNTSPLSLFLGAGSSLLTPEYNQLVNGVLAILCLKFINDGEKIVRKIFGFQDDNSSTSMAAGMAVGMMAVKNAQKMGQSARKGVNFAKNTGSRLSTALKTDAINGKFGIAISEKFNPTTKANIAKKELKDKKKEERKEKKEKRQKKISGFKSKLPHNRLKSIASRGGVKGYLAGKYLHHNSLSSTLGMMGAAMAYSTGSTDALTAIGTGSAISKGSQEFFSSSKNTMVGLSADEHNKQEQKDYEKLNREISEITEDVEEDSKALNQADEYESLIEKANDSDEEKRLINKAIRKAKGAEAYEQRAKEAREHGKEGEAQRCERKAQERRKEEEEARKQAEATESAQARKKAEEMDEKSGGRLSSIAADRDGFKSRLDEKKSNLKDLEEDKSKFFDADSVEKRFRARKKPSESELQAKKNEIVQRLVALKKTQIAKDTGKSDQDVELSVEDTDTINRTAQTLIESIANRASLPGSGIDEVKQNAFVKQQLGLSGDSHEIYRDLYRATSDYETLERNKNIAGINSNAQKLGIDSEAMDNAVLGRLLESSKRAKRKLK